MHETSTAPTTIVDEDPHNHSYMTHVCWGVQAYVTCDIVLSNHDIIVQSNSGRHFLRKIYSKQHSSVALVCSGDILQYGNPILLEATKGAELIRSQWIGSRPYQQRPLPASWGWFYRCTLVPKQHVAAEWGWQAGDCCKRCRLVYLTEGVQSGHSSCSLLVIPTKQSHYTNLFSMMPVLL